MCLFFRVSAAVAACLSVSTVCCAANDELEEVVVTATRVAQPVSQVIGSVTVITRAEIERRQAKSLQDLLQGEAGLTVTNTGGLGKLSAVFLRGAEPDHTLFLVDGVRLGSATAGTTSIEYIPVEQIERIEIVRGPRSSLYGPDAIGGVIQIFTRKAEGVTANAGYGTHRTQDYSSSFGMKSEQLNFSVSGNYLQTEGFNSCSGNAATFQGCGANEPDKDGFRSSSASAHLGYSFGTAANLELSTLYAQGYTEYDGFYNQTRFRESAPTAKLRVQATDAWTLTVSGGITQDKADNFSDAVFMSRFNTEKRNASLQSDFKPAEGHTLTMGADYLEDMIDSNIAYDRTSRHNTGVFAQYQAQLSSQEFLGAVRNDDNEQFGHHTTGNLGWKWFVVNHTLALNAGWGSAFHAPSFNDLYYPGFSNPLLKPERSQSYELGASGEMESFNWSLQAFATEAKDLIALDANFIPANISTARLRGVELTAHKTLGAFGIALNYSMLDPRSRDAGANYNHVLARRARQSGRVDLTYTGSRLQLGASVNAAGARYDDLANTVRLGGYTTVDVTADMTLGAGWSLRGKIANAFDRAYETARYYNHDGRNFFAGVQYQMK